MTIEAGKGGAAGRRLRLGMVGGGQGAFLGAVHRIAALALARAGSDDKAPATSS